MKAEINFDKSTLREIDEVSDKIMYAIARQTLDRVISSKATPHRSGDMERSMTEMGVRQDDRGYVIGNFTPYASYVYMMGPGTNWTRAQTKPQWLDYIWNTKKQTIIGDCVKEYEL